MEWVSIAIGILALAYTGYQDWRYHHERRWLAHSFYAVLVPAIRNSPPEEVVRIINDQMQHIILPRKEVSRRDHCGARLRRVLMMREPSWIAPKPETYLFLTEACSIALSCELPLLPAQECMTTLYPR
jgi:hypothetical protein